MTAIFTPPGMHTRPSRRLRLADILRNLWEQIAHSWPSQSPSVQAKPVAPTASETVVPASAPPSSTSCVDFSNPTAAAVLSNELDSTVDLQAVIRCSRSAKLNPFAIELLRGSTGVKRSTYSIEGEFEEPLYIWTTPTGDRFYECVASLPGRPYALVLYRDHGGDTQFELVKESM